VQRRAAPCSAVRCVAGRCGAGWVGSVWRGLGQGDATRVRERWIAQQTTTPCVTNARARNRRVPLEANKDQPVGRMQRVGESAVGGVTGDRLSAFHTERSSQRTESGIIAASESEGSTTRDRASLRLTCARRSCEKRAAGGGCRRRRAAVQIRGEVRLALGNVRCAREARRQTEALNSTHPAW
jgi:hypothetical protein